MKKLVKLLHEAGYKLEPHKYRGTDFRLCWMRGDEYFCNDDLSNMMFLIDDKYKISEIYSHSLAFSEELNKWYGWSHRAFYGFTIGDKVQKGDISYQPSTKKDFEESCIYWIEMNCARDEENGTRTQITEIKKDVPNPDGYYTYQPTDDTDNTPTDEEYHEPDPDILGICVRSEVSFFGKQKDRKTITHTNWNEYPETYGRGEYTIATMEEAKQEAIAFTKAVS